MSRRFVWIMPPPSQEPSGGDLFNQEVSARWQGEGRRVVLASTPADARRAAADAGSDEFVLLDSLFLQGEADWSAFPREEGCWGWLLHYLPSQTDSRAVGLRAEGLWEQEKEALARSGRVLATGRLAGELARPAAGPGARVEICEPGVRLPFPVELKPVTSWRALSVAALRRARGFMDLIEAFEQAAPLLPDRWRWRIAGSLTAEPQFAGEFRRRLLDSAIADRVDLLGHLGADELRDEVAEASLFVSGARWESYGMALAEAVSSGLPAVVTDTGCAREFVTHGENGWIATPGDPASLAVGLTRAAENRSWMAKRAPRDARSFGDCALRFQEALGELAR